MGDERTSEAGGVDVKGGTAPEEHAKPPTFSVLQNQRFLVSGVSLDDALLLSAEQHGNACIVDATGKLACLAGIAHTCVCEDCNPENWPHGERESLEKDVAAARAAQRRANQASDGHGVKHDD
jgi:hypothetical protein